MSRAFFDAVHADPWARDFVDLAHLNAGASGAVEGALERIRTTARAEPHALRSTSLVILGPPGAGKTHLFSRLRRRVGPRAVFVHVRPLLHADMTPRFLLGEVVGQLAFATPQGIPQASALVGSLLGHLGGFGAAFPSAALGEYSELSSVERTARLDAALERLLSIWPDLHETYLERLLRVPFTPGSTGRALLAWLSGRDCDASQLERIGAAASLGEEHALAALRTLSAVAALGSPIALVFDQLENLIDAEGAGPRLRAYSNLAAECVDTLRGTVLVHLALDSEWDRGIEPAFNLSQRSRIVMHREVLALPRAREREDLLRLLLERVPEPHEAFPWPLGEARLQRLRTEPGMTPRMLLIEFRRALDGEAEAQHDASAAGLEHVDATSNVSAPGSAVASDDLDTAHDAASVGTRLRDIEGEWQHLLDGARSSVHAATEDRVPLDAARLADGLLAMGKFVPGVAVQPKATPPACLLLETSRGPEHVSILDQSNHRSIGAVLGKLATIAVKARVLILRERARELPPTWKETLRRRETLLATGRARWVDIDPEDCARVLALAALLQSARSGEVTDTRGEQVGEKEVRDWVKAKLVVEAWTISAELGPSEEGSAETQAPETSIEPAVANPPPVPSTPRAPSALSTLRRLRVASFERLVREVSRIDPESTRASILAELDAAGESVRWLGRSIVFLRTTE